MEIRQYQANDWDLLWPILRATFQAGDTYAFLPDSSENDIAQVWIDAPLATYVLKDDHGSLVGSYIIKANQPGLGAHVCNCGYVVSQSAFGRGLATLMCEHSQAIAIERGFRAMQFNLVVSTNERAVALWKRLGFAIVGTLPNAFNHSRLGFVDAFVMFKTLVR